MSWIGENRAISAVDWIEENKPHNGPFIVYFKDNPISVTLDINESKNNQNILNLKFSKEFKKTYCDSRQFFYKFGRGIIKRLLLKKHFNCPKNLVLKLC